MLIININGKEVYGIIYKITNTINGKCYIGQTKNKRGFRGRYYHSGDGIERVYKYHKHNQQANKYVNTYLLKSIEKYGFDAFKVDEVFDTAMSKEELDEKEIYYIKLYDSFNNGYNMTTGGEGGNNEDQPKGKDNPTSIPIIQLTLDGKYIKTWGSLGEIKRNTSFNVPNIVMTCRGINSHSYNCLWIYEKDYNPNKEYKWIPSKNCRAIVLVDDNNNVIQEFPSVAQASRSMHIDRKTVRDSCNNVWGIPKYKFKYKDKYIEEQRLNEKDSAA